MKPKTKKTSHFFLSFFLLVGYVLLLGEFIFTTYVTFMIAYFNPSKSVCIHVNLYGEAFFEIIFIQAIIIIGFVGFAYLWRASFHQDNRS